MNYTEGKMPSLERVEGAYSIVEKLSVEKHARDLYDVFGPHSQAQDWTYLALEPFDDYDKFLETLTQMERSTDPYYLTIIDKKTNRAIGSFAYMRIDFENRAMEIGWVVYSDLLKRSRVATEAQYLAMKYVFEELHYRRYEWKCDHLNRPSHNAALRLGFTYEGMFRNAAVYKGRTRDTDWFSIIDSEWPKRKKRLELWLSPQNFDATGKQIISLNSL